MISAISTSNPAPSLDALIYQVNVDKPRRGAGRYSTIMFSGSEARLLRRILAMCEPARDTLANLGLAEDGLLIAYAKGSNSKHPSGLFITGLVRAARRCEGLA